MFNVYLIFYSHIILYIMKCREVIKDCLYEINMCTLLK